LAQEEVSEEEMEVDEQEREELRRAAQSQVDRHSRKRKARDESTPFAEESASPRKRLHVRRRLPTQANENNDNNIDVEQVQQQGEGVDDNADQLGDQLVQVDNIEQPAQPDDEVLPTVENVVEHVGALKFEQRNPLPENTTPPNRIAMLKQLQKRVQKLRQDRHETGEYIDHEYNYRILIEEEDVPQDEE